MNFLHTAALYFQVSPHLELKLKFRMKKTVMTFFLKEREKMATFILGKG